MNCLTYFISIIFAENIYGFFHTNARYYSFPKYMYNTIPYQRTMNEPTNDDVYDFIIIGSGSSGSVLANRLSEITTWKILLLEAGYPANILNKIPIFSPIFAATKYSWNYTTERQQGICEGMEGKVCPWPRGKALGGTTI
ncbi:hypothetical protein WA026_015245 [Henosepilachna vigintioctopunctata]|uniref:Uncharacterized protein n=1 Tax=Henosepilachna vigintioctopunctata TaxID=420089 RepID=A0AAW1TVZ7_9CUCU